MRLHKIIRYTKERGHVETVSIYKDEYFNLSFKINIYLDDVRTIHNYKSNRVHMSKFCASDIFKKGESGEWSYIPSQVIQNHVHNEVKKLRREQNA